MCIYFVCIIVFLVFFIMWNGFKICILKFLSKIKTNISSILILIFLIKAENISLFYSPPLETYSF